MTYQIEIPRAAAKELAGVAQPNRDHIKAAIFALADDPRPNGCAKLAGFQCAYRIRVGSYRVIYEIRDQVLVVTVVKVGHRRDVYR
jgi:mRNA interferase RelE/StbE